MMSDDLVERLRDVGRNYDFHENALIYEAADEIEQLRAALKLAQSLDDPLLLEIERQRARIAALEEALSSIEIYGSDTLSGPLAGIPNDRKWQRDGVLEMTRRARAALAKGEVK